MAAKNRKNENLPTVSKQTAGGITGAVIGGMLGGPVGAVAAGVAGAMIGDSSAKGNKPIKGAVESVRSTLGAAKGMKSAKHRRKTSPTATKLKRSARSAVTKSARFSKKATARKVKSTRKRPKKKT